MSNYSALPSMQPPAQGVSAPGPNSAVLSQTNQNYPYEPTSMLPMDKEQQTMMWQQNQYLTDSGINSAFGTHTPSVSSHQGLEDMDHEDMYMPNQNAHWNANSISAFQPDQCLMSPGTPGGSSCVLGESMADGGAAVPNPSNGSASHSDAPEFDSEMATKHIPDLIRMIQEESDSVIINGAAYVVYQMSREESIDALINSREMLDCIIYTLSHTTDHDTIRHLAGTLYNMSQKPSGLKAIFSASCVPSLVHLLDSSTESVLFYAITTLHNLLLHQDEAKAAVRQTHCIQKMVALLQKNNIKFLAICTDCLQILAYGHQESKLAILASGGPKELVRILSTNEYEKLLWTTTRVLKVLSVCPSNKPAILDAHGMDALASHLHHQSSRLVHNCLWTLRNLSDAATRMDNLDGLLHKLVQLLQTAPDPNTIICAAGILSNLTCNNQKNKLVVCKLGGIETLMNIITRAGDKVDILDPSLCALRHITSRHEMAENAQKVFRQVNGLFVVNRVLYHCVNLPQCNWTLIKPIVGLLRNLALCPANQMLMREKSLVSSLIVLLCKTQAEIANKLQQSQTLSNSFTVIQGVRLEELIEGACAVLHSLTHDSITRSILIKGVAVPKCNNPAYMGLGVFVQLLYSPHETIQRVAAGILCELSKEPDGLESVANMPSAAQRLREMTQSKNEAILTYATTILYRLSEGLPSMDAAQPTNLPPNVLPSHPVHSRGPGHASAMPPQQGMHPHPHAQHQMPPVSQEYLQAMPHHSAPYPHHPHSTHMRANHPVGPPQGQGPPPTQQQSLSAMLGPPPSVEQTSQPPVSYMHQSQVQHQYQEYNSWGAMDTPHAYSGCTSMSTSGYLSPVVNVDPVIGGDFMADLSSNSPPNTDWYSAMPM